MEGAPLLPGAGGGRGNGGRFGAGRERRRGGEMPRAAALAGSAPLLFGYSMGYTSPAEASLRAAFPSLDWSLFAALVLGGACAGSLVAPACSDALGRRRALQLCGAAPAALGWAAIASAGAGLGGAAVAEGAQRRIRWLCLGRFASGLGIGSVSAVCPLYLAETAPTHLRGLYGATFQLSITLGIALAYGAGLQGRQGSPLWLGMAWGGVALALCLALAMELVPESPRWLLYARGGGSRKAYEALERLRGADAAVGEELATMEQQRDVSREAEAAPSPFEEGGASNGGSQVSSEAAVTRVRRLGLAEVLKDRSLLLPVGIGVGMQVFQQISGINSFIMFTGGVVGSPALGALVMGAQVLATTVSFAVVDQAGRRAMLVASSLVMAASSAALGLLFHLHVPPGGGGGGGQAELPPGVRHAAAAAIVVYIVGFSLGLGPIPWTLNGELFPGRIRAFASSLATLTNWLCACLSVWSFDRLQSWSPGGTFFLYSGACALCSAFVVFCVPETRGKSLEEIEQVFRRRAGCCGKNK